MDDLRIVELLNIKRRYLRSAHLERDFRDPSALEGYVVTRQIQSSLDRIATGLEAKSGQRAWRITGNYGSGKSSFALLLAHVFAGKHSELPPQLRRVLDLSKVKEARRRFLPVLITGSREPLALAVSRALGKTLDAQFDKRAQLKILEQIRTALGAHKVQITDEQALEFLLEANSELIAKGRTDGLLIILDELGKFLEFAALHPERQDVFFLQQLAELSTRSSREPLFTIGLLHQGFDAYADQLSQSAQKEWEKISGRFEELFFDQPLHQVTQLIGAALNVSEKRFPRGTDTRAKVAMRSIIDLGWFGVAAPITSLVQAAPSLYPLHPATVPVLVRLFSRFGQNERSLFSFLLSNEPFGLQSFAQQKATANSFYRTHDLYDYAAANFGHRLSVQSYRSHWNRIDSLVRSFPSQNELDVAILKTVGLLSLINSVDFVASEEAIASAVAWPDPEKQQAVRDAIHRLHKERHVLYLRGKQGGYCLWSHTSVNLEVAYAEATRSVGSQGRVAAQIKEHLDARPIVARRHYIQTGNLRHFEVVYCSLLELEKMALSRTDTADGRILIPLCETPEEVQLALTFATEFTGRTDTLIGLTHPLGSLAGLLQEVQRWQWIEKMPELKDDRYAAEEVARQLSSAEQTLQKRVQHYAGIRQSSRTDDISIQWFSEGKLCQIRSGTEFLSFLSDLCDEHFDRAPRIHNELVNRRSLSSAAASGRMRLIERMFESSGKEFLGMDPAKKPPEMSMYLSVLLEAKLHVESAGVWTIREPLPQEDPCNLLPGLSQIREILASKPDTRVPVTTILDALRAPPFGIRNGIIPVLLVVVLLEHQHEIALYENGTFLSHVGSEEILRLTKAPNLFELQYVKIQGVRQAVFEKLIEILGVTSRSRTQTEVLEVVRPLCVFVANLPEYTRNTRALSLHARAVRDTILHAREPVSLLFKDLPEALGLDALGPEQSSKLTPERAQEFLGLLQAALNELKVAFALVKDRIRNAIFAAFDTSAQTLSLQIFRNSLSERCQSLLVNIREIDLKAFCLRILDNHLEESDWLESIASYVSNSPPSRWKDEDETIFDEKVRAFAQKFLRVESIHFASSKQSTSRAAFRVAITAHDGSERDRVVHLAPEEEREAVDLEKRLSELLTNNERVSLTAASRVMWRLLEKNNEQSKS